jgi:hypothetical protein
MALLLSPVVVAGRDGETPNQQMLPTPLRSEFDLSFGNIFDRLIRRREDVVSARVKLALHSPDDPVAGIGRHLPFKRLDEELSDAARFAVVDVVRNPHPRAYLSARRGAVLNRLYHNWSLPELHCLSSIPELPTTGSTLVATAPA